MIPHSSVLRRSSVLAVALSAMLAGACTSSTEPPPTTPSASANLDGRGPIKVAIGKDLSGQRPQEVAAWNTAHPDQRVTLIELPEAPDLQRQALIQYTQVKSTDVAVFRLDAVWTAEFAANSWVVPIPDGRIDTSGYLPQTLDTARYFGKTYAIPDATGAGLLFYRKDLLEEAGLDPPTTWAELKAACQQIKANPQHKTIGCYGGQFQKYEGLTVNFSEAVNSAGGAIVDDQGRPTVDTPQAREALSFLADSFRDGTIPRGAITWQEEQGRQAFQQGELIFLRNWPYVWASGQKNDGSSKIVGDFDVTPLPGLDGPGVSTLGGNNFAVSSFATNKATALDFIAWLNRPSQQKLRMLTTASPPPLRSVYTDAEVVKANPYMPTLLKGIEAAKPRPVVVPYGDLTLAIQDAVYPVLQGQKPVDQSLSDLQTKLLQVLKK